MLIVYSMNRLLYRFMFILLGPDGKAQQYHEIGRSMATIMTDEVRERLTIQEVMTSARDMSIFT